MINVGDIAPDFELNDQTRQPVRLSDYKGKKNVLVVFFPFAFSGICTGELCSIQDDITSFRTDDIETLAISTDAVHANKAFADKEKYDFPVLSDFWPHGAAAKAYDVFNEDIGCAERGTFLIDKEGVVRFAVRNAVPDAREQGDYLTALKEVGAL